MNSDLEAISLSVPSLCQPLDMMGGSSGESSGRVHPGAGIFWQDPSSCKSAHIGVISLPSDSGTLLTTVKCKNRAVQVSYVRNSETSQPLSPENMALQCLKDACDIVGFKLDIIPFGKLDFGETSVLDHFYNAGKSTDGSFGNVLQMNVNVIRCMGTDIAMNSLLTTHMHGRHSPLLSTRSVWFLTFFQESSQNGVGDRYH